MQVSAKKGVGRRVRVSSALKPFLTQNNVKHCAKPHWKIIIQHPLIMNNANHPKKERTFIIIKPDGIQRTLVGEIIRRYERTGLKLVALKMTVPDEKTVVKHYTVDPNWIRKVGEKSIVSYQNKGLVAPFKDPEECGRAVLGRLKKYLTTGPVIAMVWQGNKAVGIVRKLNGGTEPLTSDVGTIRGDFTIDSYDMSDLDDRAIRNLIHASGSVDEAEKEIAIWFKKDEILSYRLIQEQILYDVNIDGRKE